MATAIQNLRVCLGCKFRSEPEGSRVTCLADETGQTIQEHCEAGECPLSYLRPVTRQPRPGYMDCIYRGPMSREQQCDTCTGKVMAPVSVCQIHGECSVFSKQLSGGVKMCMTCLDRESGKEKAS